MKTKIKDLKQCYRQLGYEHYHVRVFEDYAYYFQNRAYMNEQRILKIDSNGNQQALQGDITMSLFKEYLGTQLTSIQKYYYDGPTYSNIGGANPGIKTQRMLGIEFIGVCDIYSDIEVLTLAQKTLSSFDRPYIIEIAVSGFLEKIIGKLHLDEQEEAQLLDAVAYKKSTVISDVFSKIEDNFLEGYLEFIQMLLTVRGNFKEVLKKIMVADNFGLTTEISDYLQEIAKFLPGDQSEMQLDFSLKNQQNYYDGIMFRGYLENISYPILRGGRSRISDVQYTNTVSSVGFSFVLDDKLWTFFKKEQPKIEYLILYKEMSLKLVEYLEKLQKKGVSIIVLPQSSMVGNKMDQAYTRYEHIIYFDKEGAGVTCF
ncbi:ATP phosphoribosyltransferase regulatory subunit [Erysipelotrichaceae bacterium]|nr:ATP phosphoribosyltransferase regulatory subunit [Erysipelotrichaceae bacterium]